MLSSQCVLFCLVLVFALSAVVQADESPKDSNVLDPTGEDVKKLVVTSGQLGYRNTLVFYTFADQHAVLRVVIDNKSTDFPLGATLFQFDKKATADGLAKWLNNQHSDGLYPEVPEPIATAKVPAKHGKVKSFKLDKKETQPFGTYDKYTVEFALNDVPRLGGMKIKDFKDEATVYIKTGEDFPSPPAP